LIFLTLANQKQELPLAAIFVGGMGRNEEIYRGPYIDAFCQVWFHLVQLYQLDWTQIVHKYSYNSFLQNYTFFVNQQYKKAATTEQRLTRKLF
jgi:hypothetical protein